MFNFLHKFSFVLIFSCLFLALSCDIDRRCEDVICGFNETCSAGNCFCADGLEGEDCSEQAIFRYEGSYLVFENCFDGIGSGTHNSFFSSNGRVNEILINNFAATGAQVLATIHTDQTNRSNFFEIRGGGNGIVRDVNGTGLYNEQTRQLELNVAYIKNGRQQQCTLTYNKQ